MRIRYDPDADALYLRLSEEAVNESDEVAPGVIVDYSSGGVPVGLEILDASKRFGGGLFRVEVELAPARSG